MPYFDESIGTFLFICAIVYQYYYTTHCLIILLFDITDKSLTFLGGNRIKIIMACEN